jgi:tRNA(fMet)-specific endonuclease VapC
MGVLIDASVLIEHERGRLSLDPYLDGRESEEFFLSVITVSELLHGVHRASDPQVKARRSAWVESMLDRMPILTIDTSTARAHSQVWSHLAEIGRMIGPHDLWLAASCIAHGLSLVTANLREFERVPGLQLESWSPGS